MYIAIGMLVVLGVAVLVHEFGHFIIARRNGVRVEEFCIGFPPRIFSVKKGETVYSLGMIPVGGFVKMAGEDPEAVSGAPDEFFSKSIPVRMRIAMAGPAGNFVCAYLCILIYLWTGGVKDTLPILGTPLDPQDKTVYEQIGVSVGDRIVEVRGRNPRSYNESLEFLFSSDSWPASLSVQRGDTRISVRLDSEGAHRLADAAYPRVDPVISRVLNGGPADLAGLKAGDRVTDINGQPIAEWSQLQKMISSSPGETLVIGIIRDGSRRTLSMTTSVQRQQKVSGEIEKVGRIGVMSPIEGSARHFGFWEGLAVAGKETARSIEKFIYVLWHLITGDLSMKLLGGPVGIAQVAGEKLRVGPHEFLDFLASINANLGFINLMPFFLVTDGGLIFLFCIEAVRRKKMSIKSLERWHKLGWAMVLTLLIVATYNDLMIRLELGEKVSRGIDALKRMF